MHSAAQHEGVVGRAAPCTCGSAGRWPATSEATAEATAGFPWDGEVGPVAGDAVNPSMEARSPHPCGSFTPSRLPLGAAQGAESASARQTAVGFVLWPYRSKSLVHPDLAPQRQGSAKLTLRGRDGAAEPPWMGLRRVSVSHLAAVA